jgi:hypothetical protein
LKKLFLLLFLSFFTLTSFACQSQSEEMKLLGNISEISISKSNGYGGLNENYFVSINQAEAIVGFEEVLKNARGKNQDVDVTNGKPDYDILIRYENGDTHGLHLILGNTGAESIVMYIGHENIGYFISPEETNKIRKLLDVL